MRVLHLCLPFKKTYSAVGKTRKIAGKTMNNIKGPRMQGYKGSSEKLTGNLKSIYIRFLESSKPRIPEL